MHTFAFARLSRRTGSNRRPLAQTLAASLLAFALLSSAGCGANTGERPSESGNVAVIDLDVVFEKLGRDSDTKAALNQKRRALEKRLAELQTAAKQQIEVKQKEFGEEPTDAQKRELQVIAAGYGAEQDKARNEYAEFKEDLIVRFREEVKPVARQVAKSKGFSIVLTKLDHVYIHPPEADITEDVVAQMVKSGGGSKDE